jgi:hypothetical protein
MTIKRPFILPPKATPHRQCREHLDADEVVSCSMSLKGRPVEGNLPNQPSRPDVTGKINASRERKRGEGGAIVERCGLSVCTCAYQDAHRIGTQVAICRDDRRWCRSVVGGCDAPVVVVTLCLSSLGGRHDGCTHHGHILQKGERALEHRREGDHRRLSVGQVGIVTGVEHLRCSEDWRRCVEL